MWIYLNNVYICRIGFSLYISSTTIQAVINEKYCFLKHLIYKKKKLNIHTSCNHIVVIFIICIFSFYNRNFTLLFVILTPIHHLLYFMFIIDFKHRKHTCHPSSAWQSFGSESSMLEWLNHRHRKAWCMWSYHIWRAIWSIGHQ